MEVTQEEDNTGTGNNNNANNNNQASESSSANSIDNTKSKNPIKQFSADVDLTKKPEIIKEPFNLLGDEDISAQINVQTEEEKKKEQKPQQSEEELKKLRDGINQEPPVTATPPVDKAKRRKKAEKYADLLDKIIVRGLQWWSGQADDAGLRVPTGDITSMADDIEDIMNEYNFNGTHPVVEGITKVVAVYSTPFKNAKKSKKLMDDFKKTEKYKQAKEAEALRQEQLKEKKLDLFTGKHDKKKGGQRKA